ncbi:MAG: SMP-30/gluconolactonase/LRE family protein [Actinomycetes bacterium]
MSVEIHRLTERDVLVRDAGDLCEGPCWDVGTQTLVFVDILAGAVNVVDPATGSRSRHLLGAPVGAVAPRTGGGWVAAVERGFLLLDAGWRREGEVVAAPGQGAGTRFNDGGCDPSGRFWAGTLSYDGAPGAAALYRFDPDGSVRQLLGGVTNSNGIAWSPDGTRVYYVDTGLGRVDRLDLDAATGEVVGRTTVIRVPSSEGLPDGLTIDAEGHLWLALWGGGCVRRYTPDGELQQVLELPVELVTSPCFGGPALDELFITTARDGLSDTDLAAQPLAGSVFRWRPGVRGLAPLTFAG